MARKRLSGLLSSSEHPATRFANVTVALSVTFAETNFLVLLMLYELLKI